MKKKVLLVISFILVLGIGIFMGTKFSKSNLYEEEDYVPKVTHKNMLSMMLETDSGSGDYSLETRSSWPTKEDGYVFNSTLSKCEKGSKLRWDDENNAVVMVGTTSDKCYVYFDVYNQSLGTIADWVIAQYTGTQGENNLYYHDSTLENGAGDNSYRYAGSSSTTNNYVCFGSDADTCPNDNLYRIIGVFDGRVRLIKADYATATLLGTDTSDYKGTYSETTSYYQGDNSNLTNIAEYYWNKANCEASYSETNYYNDWSYSELNKTHLNKNFLANIGSVWENIIDKTTWKVGGLASASVVPATAYTNEITNPSTQVTNTYESKVGLMYVSDYGFAASLSSWTTTLKSYNSSSITSVNWMYMGLYEWTMARSSYSDSGADIVSISGMVFDTGGNGVNYSAVAVRPVFHLVSSVEYSSGTGTKNDPIRIKID